MAKLEVRAADDNNDDRRRHTMRNLWRALVTMAVVGVSFLGIPPAPVEAQIEAGQPFPNGTKLADGVDLDLWGAGGSYKDLRSGYAGIYGLELNSDIAWPRYPPSCLIKDGSIIEAGQLCSLWVAVSMKEKLGPEGAGMISANNARVEQRITGPNTQTAWTSGPFNTVDWLLGETYYFPTSTSLESFNTPGSWVREYRIAVGSLSSPRYPYENLVFQYEVVPSRGRAPQSGFAQMTSGEVSIGWTTPPWDGGSPITGYEVYMIPVPENEYHRDLPYQYASHESWEKVCDFSDRPELQICDVPNNNVRTIEAGEYRFAIYSLSEAFPEPPSSYTTYALMTDKLTVPTLTNIPPPTPIPVPTPVPVPVPIPTPVPTPVPVPIPVPVPTPTPTPVPPEVVLVVDYVDASNLVSLVHAVNYSDKLDAPVLRLYQAFFNREPDLAGAKYWLGIRRQGYGLLQIAGFMAQGQEFAGLYRGNSDGQYLTAVYANVLGRAYDQGGFDYWLVLLVTDQLDRVEVVFYVTQNVEFINTYPFTK